MATLPGGEFPLYGKMETPEGQGRSEGDDEGCLALLLALRESVGERNRDSELL